MDKEKVEYGDRGDGGSHLTGMERNNDMLGGGIRRCRDRGERDNKCGVG